MNKKILISGASGFVAQNLIPYLNNFYTPIGISRTASNNFISYNSLNKKEWDTAYAFIHLAGKAHDLKNSSNKQAYFDINTDLTKTLFQQFIKSDCQIFIYMSSVKAIADTVATVLTEATHPNPKTAYGKSKLAAEEYLIKQKLPSNKKVYILRPCMIHGPGNKGNLNLLYKVVEKGIPYPLGSFKNKRSFLTVENLCFAIQQLLQQQPKSNTFNLADDEAISTNTLIKTIGDAIEKKASVWNVPKFIIYTLATIGSLLKLPFNKERLTKLTENYVVDNSHLKKTLNIHFPISTLKGLTTTIQSFKDSK